jgi:hypothetical protein
MTLGAGGAAMAMSSPRRLCDDCLMAFWEHLMATEIPIVPSDETRVLIAIVMRRSIDWMARTALTPESSAKCNALQTQRDNRGDVAPGVIHSIRLIKRLLQRHSTPLRLKLI